MRRSLNTDFTDYTDNLFGDADSSLSSVMRSVFEHGLHGLFFGGHVKTGGFGPIVRELTSLSVISVKSVFNKNIHPWSHVVQLWSQTVERRRRQMARWVVVLISRQTCREVATRR